MRWPIGILLLSTHVTRLVFSFGSNARNSEFVSCKYSLQTVENGDYSLSGFPSARVAAESIGKKREKEGQKKKILPRGRQNPRSGFISAFLSLTRVRTHPHTRRISVCIFRIRLFVMTSCTFMKIEFQNPSQ